MHDFETLSALFSEKFSAEHFPAAPASLYDPGRYFLKLGGKRIRPVLCLMGNDLFDELSSNSWNAAMALELFHNFTLIHDDIMDQAPLRRGKATVHTLFGPSTALLTGDAMVVTAYAYLAEIQGGHLSQILRQFNQMALEVCEGQQRDMDYEQIAEISLEQYLQMIEQKTSVLLACSLRMGAILGGASQGNQEHLGAFGRNLGLAFQIQDDYLDVFGDPEKVGKKLGGDILANKKTFLLVKALEAATPDQKEEILQWLPRSEDGKVEAMTDLFRRCGAADAARLQIEAYQRDALRHLDEVAVLSPRKVPLRSLAEALMGRQF